VTPRRILEELAGRTPDEAVFVATRELRRRALNPWLRRRLEALGPGDVARRCGVASLDEILKRRRAEGFLFRREDANALREIHTGLPGAERDALRSEAEAILVHEFDILGSGPVSLGPEIDWHCDFKSGHRWPLEPAESSTFVMVDTGIDVKVPWELSRCQHFTTLARGWVLTGERRYVAEIERQIRSWITSNPTGKGVNWASTMDVALRAVSWAWGLMLLSGAELGAESEERALLALFRHGAWIERNLEFSRPSGNHLLADVLGLVVCGALFREAAEGRRWLDRGRRIFERQVLIQVGADGVNFEGSTSYHALVLEILLVGDRVLSFAGRPFSRALRMRLEAMAEFLSAAMPDQGPLPVIGDADDGRALRLGPLRPGEHRHLLASAAVLFNREDFAAGAGPFWEDSVWLFGPTARRGLGIAPSRRPANSRLFANSGFAVLRSSSQYVFVDGGPVGFSGRGVHGHNDAVAFEWHARGRPLLTDSGTYIYTPSASWRNRFRATDAHNTVRVDGQEVNRIPGARSLFRLRNDARPMPAKIESRGETDLLTTGHTGYCRLPDPVTVQRVFEMPRGGQPVLWITDLLTGSAEHQVEFFFHAAPKAVAVGGVSGRAVAFSWPGEAQAAIELEVGPSVTWRVVDSWVSPSYGVKCSRKAWCAFLRVLLPATFRWKLSTS
jgi:hypothetical protein